MINLYVTHSSLTKSEYLEPIITRLETQVDLFKTPIKLIKLSSLAEIPNSAEAGDLLGAVILNLTGGTEEVVDTLLQQLKELPVLLCATPEANSLAAVMEIMAAAEGADKIKFYYVEDNISDGFVAKLQLFEKVCHCLKKASTAKIGSIGEPSSWLLTSKKCQSLGVFSNDIVKIEQEVLLNNYTKQQQEQEAIKKVYDKLVKRIDLAKTTKEELVKSLQAYLAICEIYSELKLDALTIRCFDLIAYGFTPCLAVSLCNEQGMVVGCEGDIQALISMVLAKCLAETTPWMCNILEIDKKANTVKFAHCTTPINMLGETPRPSLMTHFESDSSVATAGSLKPGEVTLLRIGGRNSNKMLAVAGEVLPLPNWQNTQCRTQTVIKLSTIPVEELINHSLGNHFVLVYGNIIEELDYFCTFANIELII